MEIREIGDDFFRVGNIAILQRHTHADYYDFDFRNYFDCLSIMFKTHLSVMLHIGAIEDYRQIEQTLSSKGMHLLISEEEHLRCSLIDHWYPVLKDKTPYTRIYDELPPLEELQAHFAFPVFIKGNRQTSRHTKSKCIIENANAYEALRSVWARDDILSWQKVAIRDYVPLQPVHANPYPDQVPVSYEFRFFCFEGKCTGYGAYWHTEPAYTLSPVDASQAVSLAEWAADQLKATFVAVDLAKTEDGRWIIIEVNDAQESGFAEINPLSLWQNIMEEIEYSPRLSVEAFLPNGAVIMGRDPLPNMTVEEMQRIVENIHDIQIVVDYFVLAHNKFWWIEDDLYDYEVGSEKYLVLKNVVDGWGDIMDELEHRIVEAAEKQGLLYEMRVGERMIKKIDRFMQKHGYYDGGGWWTPVGS